MKKYFRMHPPFTSMRIKPASNGVYVRITFFASGQNAGTLIFRKEELQALFMLLVKQQAELSIYPDKSFTFWKDYSDVDGRNYAYYFNEETGEIETVILEEQWQTLYAQQEQK